MAGVGKQFLSKGVSFVTGEEQPVIWMSLMHNRGGVGWGVQSWVLANRKRCNIAETNTLRHYFQDIGYFVPENLFPFSAFPLECFAFQIVFLPMCNTLFQPTHKLWNQDAKLKFCFVPFVQQSVKLLQMCAISSCICAFLQL